jgi:hypothetical protein
MNRRIILIAGAFAAAAILLLIYRHDLVSHSQSAPSTSTRDVAFPPRSNSLNLGVAEIQPPRPTGMGQIGAPGTSLSARPISPAEIPKLHLKLKGISDPTSSQLFTACFRLMENGDYREARLKLVAFMEGKAIRGNESLPYAWWMLAWCILNEGGKENLIDAADRFSTYAKLWPVPGEVSSMSTEAIAKDFEELKKAALFNSAVLYTELSYAAQGDQSAQDKYTNNAKESLNLFLAEWPNDPQAPEVLNLLNSINGSNHSP